MSASPEAHRTVRAAMGTVVSLRTMPQDRAAADQFFAKIEELEGILSRFRPESDLSRLASHETDFDSVDPRLRQVLTRCETLRTATEGHFDHETSGLDPGGLAKGWVIDEAAIGLRARGLRYFMINAGGDVLARRPDDSDPWRVGIRHPESAASVIAVLELTTGAIATSGDYERPGHIRGRSGLTSVSVTGPDLGTADALATAVFADGEANPKWWYHFANSYGLLTVSKKDQLIWRAPADGSGPTLSPPLRRRQG